jgi:hypothetical protein
MTLSNPNLKYSADYDKQWDNELDAKFRYCQIVGRDGETTRRFFGKADRSQATRPQAKQDTERSDRREGRRAAATKESN